MKLWHEALIPQLSKELLLKQHQECCILRGKGWNMNNATVNYVFIHSFANLVAYHFKVMIEMENRGYHPNKKWYKVDYRGKSIDYKSFTDYEYVTLVTKVYSLLEHSDILHPIYPEHNDDYLQECLKELKSCRKNIES